MTIVVKQFGKGIETAKKIELVLFGYKEQAEEFCKINTNLNTKYWTYCEIIEPNKEIELFYNNGLGY